jgi:hypothetical protein
MTKGSDLRFELGAVLCSSSFLLRSLSYEGHVSLIFLLRSLATENGMEETSDLPPLFVELSSFAVLLRST